jgi:hypothetical protein
VRREPQQGLNVRLADCEGQAVRHGLTLNRRLRPDDLDRLPDRVIVDGLDPDHDHPTGSRGVENHTSNVDQRGRFPAIMGSLEPDYDRPKPERSLIGRKVSYSGTSATVGSNQMMAKLLP